MKNLSIFILVAFMASISVNLFAQEDLSGDRTQLLSEYKDAKRLENIAKLNKALEKGPGQSGLPNVDGLALSTTTMLTETFAINELIPELYSRSVGETIDGVTDVTVDKPSLAELTELSVRVLSNVAAVTTALSQVVGATSDVASIKNPLQVKKALNTLNYSKDALSFMKDELVLQGKLIKNLIETIKSADNL